MASQDSAAVHRTTNCIRKRIACRQSTPMVELIWSSLQSYRLLCLQTFFCFLVNPVVIGAAQRESIALQRAPKASRDSKPMRVFQELYC
jgi:hypothetical protein